MSADPDRIVFATPRVTVGQWRCPRTHSRFRDSGPIERHLVAFPRTSAVIRHEGRAPFVADASLATVYNRGQRYTREALHPAGDHCEWFAVDEGTAIAIASSVDARPVRSGSQALRFARAPVNAAMYQQQRRLFLSLQAGGLDASAAEEEVLALVHGTLLAGALADGAPAPRLSAASRDVAHAAARELAAACNSKLTLDTLAQRIGVSVFHVCRSFRAVFGRKLHAHLNSLRLRACLSALAESADDLTQVALDHGFSSHSHFTAAFRREYGVTPSQWRAGSQAIS